MIVANSDIGIIKPVNQDTFLARTAHTAIGNVCMALVCDGLGGLEEGEKASQTVTLTFNQWFTEEFRNVLENEFCESMLSEAIQESLYKANKNLTVYGEQNHKKIGTTATMIIFIEDRFYTFHIGDTRIYRFDTQLSQITQDHTLVASKIQNGLLTKEQARNSPEKHILLQCVGANNLLEIHRTQGKCNSGDVFMVCSDGLYNKLSDSEISSTLKTQKILNKQLMQEEIDSMIATVKIRGETDNITGMIIKLV